MFARMGSELLPEHVMRIDPAVDNRQVVDGNQSLIEIDKGDCSGYPRIDAADDHFALVFIAVTFSGFFSVLARGVREAGQRLTA